MKVPFSIRHKKLIEQDKLRLSFNVVQRRKILYLLEEFNEIFYEQDETNWRSEETSFQKVYFELKKAYGYPSLNLIRVRAYRKPHQHTLLKTHYMLYPHLPSVFLQVCSLDNDKSK